MAKTLPSRPNLDHLRGQAKTLLARLNDGDRTAIQTFIRHLPEARGLTPAKVRGAGFRLADAQSAIARQTGFASWPALARHVQQLRSLEGEWRFDALEVDGTAVPAAMITASRLLIDGDRFRMESPEANYEGLFLIDVEASPQTIDIDFIEGPDEGQRSEGVFVLEGDALTICLGLVGASRPRAFATKAGSGHALEKLTRVSASRPAGVTGGTRKPNVTAHAVEAPPPIDPGAFDQPPNATLRALEGEWVPVELVQDGEPTKPEWLPFGRRSTAGNEMKVIFGGQVMVHAKVRVDESRQPMPVEYLHLSGRAKGKTSLGLMEWVGPEARFVMAAPGGARPDDFTSARGSGRTLSRWRRA
jgi:uncharacterized protein (TIGR03067 family)